MSCEQLPHLVTTSEYHTWKTQIHIHVSDRRRKAKQAMIWKFTYTRCWVFLVTGSPTCIAYKQTYRKETRSPSAILSRAVNKRSSSVIIHIKTFVASHGITGLLQKPQRKAGIRSWSSALIVGVRKDCLVCHHRLKMFEYQHLIQTHLISDQHESPFLRTMWQNTAYFQSPSSHLENTVVVFKDEGNVTIHHKNIYHK